LYIHIQRQNTYLIEEGKAAHEYAQLQSAAIEDQLLPRHLSSSDPLEVHNHFEGHLKTHSAHEGFNSPDKRVSNAALLVPAAVMFGVDKVAVDAYKVGDIGEADGGTAARRGWLLAGHSRTGLGHRARLLLTHEDAQDVEDGILCSANTI